MTTSCPIARIDVLGVHVSAVNIPIAIAEIDRWVRHGYRSYVTLTGVHGVMESVRNESIRRAHNAAGLVLPDGMPLVWLLWDSGFRLADRVYGPDLMLALFNHFQRTGYRHFLAGVDEDDAVIETINASAADIIWVGLSTPKQELWMARHRHRLSATVLIGVGAALDFHAGLVRQAPRWLQRSGLEWAFRIAMEPRRLAKRYLRNNPAFLALLAAERLGLVRVGRN